MKQKWKVFEIRVKMYLLQDISFKELQNVLADFVDSALCKNEELISFHEENRYKFYSIGTLWPVERGGVYKKDQIYTLTLRTVDPQLARYFSEVLKNHYTRNRLFANTVKQYKFFTGEQIEEDFSLYTNIRFLNKHPIVCKYKNISLLGDKLNLQIATDEKSQNLAYFVLGTGLLEGGSRGNGFCNFQWI